MYTRSYDNEGGIRIPERYDGNAFSAPEEQTDVKSEILKSEPLRAPWDTQKEEVHEDTVPTVAGAGVGNIFSRYIKKLPFGALNIFGGDGFHLGTEEILIIGVALFLFFSGGGDKECAIMLLLLLLVK